MSEEPGFIRWCGKIFSVTFIGFSFIIFSSLFPTGFSSVFSTFAFLAAIPIFIYRIKKIQLNSYEIVGLLLFLWISLSIFWSDVPILDSLVALSEYRLYLLVPICSLVLMGDKYTQKYALIAALWGAFLALVSSWSIGLDLMALDSGQKSLGDRIFHGFVMACFLLASLCVARESRARARGLALCISFLILYNVLNIENGRTGYLLVATVCVVFAILTFKKAELLVVLSLIAMLFVLAFQHLAGFQSRIYETRNNIEKLFVSEEFQSSAGYRLVFYRTALEIGSERPLLGVGVGGVAKEFRDRAENGRTPMLTDNVHSEYLNMFVIGGIPAVLLFIVFLGLIVRKGLIQRRSSRWLGDAFIVIGCIVTVATIFNSSVKDYGEKHALIILLALLGSIAADSHLDKNFNKISR